MEYSNFKFYDTDREIELKTKKSINEIFESDGELYFRKIEEEICLELLTEKNCSKKTNKCRKGFISSKSTQNHE